MIHVFYDIVLWLSLCFVIPYHLFRSVQRKRPAAFAERFGFIAPDALKVLDGERPIWIHAVSVGETIAVKPFLKALKRRFPDRKIVLSSTTVTGRSVALTLPEVDLCIYFPFDYRFAVRRLLSSIRPSLVLIVETEIWPNFLRSARLLGIPVAMVNGRISDRSTSRYLKMRWFFSRVLCDFAWFCMQTGEDARRIIAMGAPSDRVEITRNLKYDLPVASFSPVEKQELRSAYRIPAGISVLTAGSTHQGEDETLIAAYRQLIAAGNSLFLVLAPRHPERVPQVAELLKRGGISFTLRSQLEARTEPFRCGEALLVDTVGELLKFYAVSDMVFVGGSLVPTGGHNILEPAAQRVPVLFGPHMNNFREAAALVLKQGGGLQVRDGEELTAVLATLLKDETYRRAMGENGAKLMEDNSGSTARHLKVVERLLEGR
jgi:3-deoxy-D-manno-octulosonic-acid transferase